MLSVAISAKAMTYEQEPLMERATKISCSDFDKAIINNA
jgi:hypothetical protein